MLFPLLPLFLNVLLANKFSNTLLSKIEEAEASFLDQPGAQNAEYFKKQIIVDLNIFKGGISVLMVDKARPLGVFYQIFNGSLYRQSTCTYPVRCEGIDNMLLKIAPFIPNTEFIINDFDFPKVLDLESLVPVFSFSKNPEASYDILVPAWSFIAGGPVTSVYPQGIGKWEQQRKHILSFADRLPFSEKNSTAFFLGSRTSEYRDPLVRLSRKKPDLVDARYTKNQAYKSRKDTLGLEPANEQPLEYNCKYKFVANIRGITASFRLRHLLLCNSVVLDYGDNLIEFFNHKLIPYFHYIPIEENTEESWEQTIKFLRNHDAYSAKIAKRSQDWARSKLAMRDVLNYWKLLLTEYAKLLDYKIVHDTALERIN